MLTTSLWWISRLKSALAGICMFILVAFATAAPSNAEVSSATGRVSGYVTCDGFAGSGGAVTFYSSSSVGMAATADIDNNGYYSLQLPPGTYTASFWPASCFSKYGFVPSMYFLTSDSVVSSGGNSRGRIFQVDAGSQISVGGIVTHQPFLSSPINSVSVSGVTSVGSALTCQVSERPPVWGLTAYYDYVWIEDDIRLRQDIVSSNFTLTQKDAGHRFSCVVRARIYDSVTWSKIVIDYRNYDSQLSDVVTDIPPVTIPAAPAITSDVAGSHQVTVNFTPPSEDGGAAITNYEYSINGGSSWTVASPTQTSSPLVITGLSNGTSYSVKIRAVNSVGSGAASNAISVKPIAPASAPTISAVVAGNGQATLSISTPAQINDSSLSGYDYSINNGSTWSSFPSATGPFTITGLTNATAYQVKVRAVNSAGAGEASAAVTVNPTRLVPAKPVISSVVAGNAVATVNITTPTDVTAQSITSYQYSIDKGATYQNAVVSNGSFTISGLTNGVTTSVQIRATNFNGTSLASVAKSVIPSTTPAAPSITSITPNAGALNIAFTAPNTGGSAITSYQYSLDGGTSWVVPKTAVKSSPIRVTGLPNATNYQVSIRAVNAKGTGTASAAVSATTPVLVPTAPVITSISKSRTSITMDFNAPVNNGGGTITNYAYSTDSGRTWVLVSPASNSTRVVITGLNPSTLYPVQIAAINSAGRGASSALTRVGTLH